MSKKTHLKTASYNHDLETEVTRHGPRRLKRLTRSLPLYAMMLPGLVYLFMNNYIPMFGSYIAFKDLDFSKGMWGSDWVGFTNFEFLFKSPDFPTIVFNTLTYNIMFLTFNTIVSVAIAIFLSELNRKWEVKFHQTVILLPNLMSMVIISYIVFAFLSYDVGLINKSLLASIGSDPISWYSVPWYWRIILPIVAIWKNVGYLSVIYYAAILGVDPGLYEAAEIDGASRWQRIRKVTLPLIRPTIITMLVLGVGTIMSSDFGMFYQVPMDSGAIYKSTNVVTTYVYRALLQQMDTAMSSAAGLFQSVIGFVLVMVTNLIIRKVDKDSAIF